MVDSIIYNGVSVEYIVLNGENLSLNQFIQGVRYRKQVMLSEEAEIKVIKGHARQCNVR